MSKQYLQMKYHPAKKEIEFKRFTEEPEITEINIAEDSILRTNYMNKKGTFVLQHHGRPFFEDIARVFDGEKTVDLRVITTKTDYEDFEQMVKYYNESDGGVKITSVLSSELPDMEETCRKVCEFGEDSIKILDKYKNRFEKRSYESKAVTDCIQMYKEKFERAIRNIEDRIESMDDHSVNLFFAGVYSAGKSMLINAILGYPILPKASESTTARVFRIRSPKKEQPVHIDFKIKESDARLIWNEEEKKFVFEAGPTENCTRRAIQKVIDAHKSEPQYQQLLEILSRLNSEDDIKSEIDIYFPIPLDNERVQFTIYDTPGTDSNFEEHQRVLEEVLSEQTHSMLVLVVDPNKLEGAGNHTLLSYLKGNSETSIDIERSFFVINKADDKDEQECRKLQDARIGKSDEDFSIDLSKKKLFFTSAMYAFSAKAVEKGIGSKDDKFRFEDDVNKICRPERGRYYQYNKMGTSEYATQRLIGRCEEKLNEYTKSKNGYGEFQVCTGLYALETEMVAYGEKYAPAVRAFAIIASVDKALTDVNNEVESLNGKTQLERDQIDTEIKKIKDSIKCDIENVNRKYEHPRNKPLPSDMLRSLRLDSGFLQRNINGRAISFIENKLKKRFLVFGKVPFKEEHKEEIVQYITEILDDFRSEYKGQRKIELKKVRDKFIEEVKRTIEKNGKLSDEAKKIVQEIDAPKIENFMNLEKIGSLYDANKQTRKAIFGVKENLDKDGFKEGVDRELTKIASALASDYQQNFNKSQEGMLIKISGEFMRNIDNYSTILHAKVEDKKAIEELQQEISATANALRVCQDDLNTMIWRVKDNG